MVLRKEIIPPHMNAPLMLAVLFLVIFRSPAHAATRDVVERGSFHRTIEETRTVVDKVGHSSVKRSRYTEIASGMHYRNAKTGQWEESRAVFEVGPKGATAERMPTQVVIAPDISEDGAVEMVLSDGQRFRSNPVFISFRDTQTGKAVIVAHVKPCELLSLEPNVIVFADALTGIKAALRYTIGVRGTPGTLEQDLIFLEQNDKLDPASYGLNPATSQLELWTEFLEAGTENNVRSVRRGEVENAEIHFGPAYFGQGIAFSIGDHHPEVLVSKSWGKVDGFQFLVESVKFADLAPLLARLPLQEAKLLRPIDRTRQMAKVHETKGELVVASHTYRQTLDRSSRAASVQSMIPSFDRGVVLDYTCLLANNTDFTFAASSTFYISGPVSIDAVATFMGGTVLKFAPTNSAKLTLNSNVIWNAQNYLPVTLTARDDHSIGEAIGSNALSGYYADVALEVNSATAMHGLALKNLRIAHARTAISIDGRTDHVLSDVQIVNSGLGIRAASGTAYSLRNALLSNVLTNFSGIDSSSIGSVEHLTSDGASYVNGSGSNLTLSLTNSLVVSAGSVGALSATQSVAMVSSSAGVFRSALSGAHYLASSAYRAQGTTNVCCLADIRLKTTYPPVIISGGFSVATSLPVIAPRDLGLPDLGWHFDRLDYYVGGVDLEAALTLNPGVCVGIFGTTGFRLLSNGKLLSTGNADSLNRLVKYNSVQLGTNVWDAAGTNSFSLIQIPTTPAVRPEVALRFTEIAVPADIPSRRMFLDTGSNSNASAASIALRDCQLHNVQASFVPDTVGLVLSLTNNLWVGGGLTLVDGVLVGKPIALTAQNNLFEHSILNLSHGTNAYSWSFFDNLFDGVTLNASGSEPLQVGYNGYLNTTPLSGGSGDVAVAVADYVTGPLASSYYPTNGANLNLLRDAGSLASAASAGLYHFTTTADQVREGSSVLDVGWHVVATAGGVALDGDGDGIPDYLEDSDGDGIFDSGETDWQTYNSKNGLGSAPALVVFTPLR
jgi:hypothetical protein